MLQLMKSITKNGKIVGYIVCDTDTKNIKRLSRNTVISLAKQGMILNVTVGSKNTLRGLNGFRVTSLKSIVDEKVLKIKERKDISLELTILVGDKLRNFINNILKGIHRKRFIYNKLSQYLQSENNNVCLLYGLRRTGKTVMMTQAAEELLNKNNKVAIINCSVSTKLYTLLNRVQSLIDNGYKYIFIDEITFVDGFMQNANVITDTLGKQGAKIVLTGTHSLCLKMAELSYMYDRVYRIDTSYISFKESNSLIGTKTVEDYIKSGGLLRKNVFTNKESTDNYISTSIVDNIVSSLRKNKDNKLYRNLVDLDDRGLLRKMINQAIEYSNSQITLDMITRKYKNSYYGKAKANLAAKFDIDELVPKEEIMQHVRYYLGIVDTFDSSKDNEIYRDELVDLLRKINVLDEYTKVMGVSYRPEKTDLFMQSGLRYRQVQELIIAIKKNTEIEDNIKEFILNLVGLVEGDLLEEVIILNELNKFREEHLGYDITDESVYSSKGGDMITQVTAGGKEIDMLVVKNGVGIAYEIKRSKEVVEKQARWLTDNTFISEIESKLNCKIKHKAVIYNGPNTNRKINGQDIKYINATEFLLR